MKRYYTAWKTGEGMPLSNINEVVVDADGTPIRDRYVYPNGACGAWYVGTSTHAKAVFKSRLNRPHIIVFKCKKEARKALGLDTWPDDGPTPQDDHFV